MVRKKRLLVTASPRALRDGYPILFKEMCRDFNIVVVSVDFFTPRGFVESMRALEREGVVCKFFLLPPYRSTLKMLRMLKSITSQLKEYPFDAYLAGESIQLDTRYLTECIIPKSCIRIMLWNNLTFLLGREELLVRKLLSMNPATSNGIKLNALSHSMIGRIRQTGSVTNLLKKIWRYSKNKVRRFYEILVDRVWLRRILPKLVLGKTFPYEGYDRLTQMDSGKRFEHYMFCDEMEVQAHKALFQTPRVYVARPLTEGTCHCQSGIQKKSAVLSPLSGFIQRDTIDEKYLRLFYRDFKTVLDQTGAGTIHLRMHPDETGRWYLRLREYLSACGMDVTIVDCDKPIYEVMCDYIGMAGMNSCALRHGRASCNQAFIIGFEAVSKFAQKNPRFHFGNSCGVGWINEDGSYDPSIFERNVYVPPPRKSVSDLLRELTAGGALL